jgi:hypothetical protein
MTELLTVVTLAIRSTIEEEIVRYRAEKAERRSHKGKKTALIVTGEPRTRSYLEVCLSLLSE